MENKLTLTRSIRINASRTKVWEGLTNPELIKQYFFGTEAVSDWKVGSPLIFRGVWEGKEYVDKGTILEKKEGRWLKYNYWSSFSGTEDIPENYANITYQLVDGNNETTELTVTQDSIKDEATREHSDQNWGMVLDGLKKLLEE